LSEPDVGAGDEDFGLLDLDLDGLFDLGLIDQALDHHEREKAGGARNAYSNDLSPFHRAIGPFGRIASRPDSARQTSTRG
jgi:hypothetical protein